MTEEKEPFWKAALVALAGYTILYASVLVLLSATLALILWTIPDAFYSMSYWASAARLSLAVALIRSAVALYHYYAPTSSDA